MAQTQDGYFDRGIIKRLVKKRKTGKLGYVVGKDGKEKWYPLRFISLTHEQAEQLPVSNHNSAGNLISSIHSYDSRLLDSSTTQSVKRKRTSTALQSPKKKSKSSTDLSPDKSQRSSNTPSRRTKLFNFTYFLLTGFNGKGSWMRHASPWRNPFFLLQMICRYVTEFKMRLKATAVKSSRRYLRPYVFERCVVFSVVRVPFLD